MACVGEAIGVIGSVIEIVKLLVKPVWRQIDYLWNYKEHVDNLKDNIEKTLKDEIVNLDHRMDNDRREGNKIEGVADTWVKDADKLIKDAETILKNDENEGSENKKCRVIFCSNWRKHHQQGRNAKKLSEKVENLIKKKREKIDSKSISYNGPDHGTLEPVKGYEKFQSRRDIIKDIMEALKSPGVTRIGVYGINGIGKTTLVKAIASQAYEEQLVDEVAMATVFQEQNVNEMSGEEAVIPDIKRIQDEITDRLKFKLQSTTVNGRAEELRKRLKDEKKIRRLIILDDIWVGLKLEQIGLPDDHDGCKILMTSIDDSVLSREMGSMNFQLNLLEPQESLEWFKKMVSEVVKDSTIDEFADKVAEKCAGWPILLDTVAKALKYEKRSKKWEYTLDQLSNYDKDDIHRPVHLGLQLSFNRLKPGTKQLFLLCGLFPPNNIPINYLLRYSRGLDLFQKKCYNLADARKRLLGLVSHLKASSLLQEGYDQEILMMHNIVHSFVMSVQSDKGLTVLSGNDLPQWSEKIDLEKCTAISLLGNISELPDEFKCPNLNFFLLCSDDSSPKVPERFFSATGKLKVMDLTNADFSSSLPQSLQYLTNLQTLCLEDSKLDGVKNMKIIGQLKNLKILSFRGSHIVKLPIEIKQLSHLQLLDLSQCQQLEEIPRTLLSGLKQLEDLHLEDICLNWEVEGTKNEFTELASLKNLRTLDIQIANTEILKEAIYVFSEKLERFQILIGDCWDWFDSSNYSKTLKLAVNGRVLSLKWVRALIKKVEELYLEDLDVGKTSLCEIAAHGFPCLKHLHMKMVRLIQYINSMARGSSAAFTMLESLYLDNLENLEKILHGKFTGKSFGNLRMLKVKNCPELKNLFSTSMASGLSRLEEFKISHCGSLKEIFTEESEDDTHKVLTVSFPQLQKLTFKSLPKLTSFWSKQNEIEQENVTEAPITKPLFNEKLSCPNLKELKLSSLKFEKIWQERVSETSSSSLKNLTSVNVHGCNDLKYLLSFSAVKFLVNLKSLQISNCKMMREVILMEGFQGQMVLQHLEVLHLENLPELAGFCSSNLQNMAIGTEEDMTDSVLFNDKLSCPNLKELKLSSLKFEKIWQERVSETSFSSFKNLTSVNVAEAPITTPLFNEKLSCPNLKELELSSLKFEKIWQKSVPGTSSSSFQNLTSVNVDGCDDLKYLFSFSAVKSLVNLESLWISNCKMMREVLLMEGVQDHMVLEHLEVLHLLNLPELEGFCSSNLQNKAVGTVLFNDQVAFPNLEVLAIDKMAKLDMIWDSDLHDHEDSFRKLRRLRISFADKLLNIFPSSCAQTRLQNLEFLWVSYCESLEEVFGAQPLKNASEINAITSQLKGLNLLCLPKLRRIWSKEALEIVSFQNIQTVTARQCPNLKSLFPVSLAKELRELRTLDAWTCGIEEIISKDESEESEQRFRFPQLSELSFADLPQLKKFYSGRGTVECPALTDFTIEVCDKVKILVSKQGHLEVQSKGIVNATVEKGTTLGVHAGQASDTATAEKIATPSFPTGKDSSVVVADKNIIPAEIIATEETRATFIVPGDQVLNNFEATKHSDSDHPSGHETGIKVTIEGNATSSRFQVSKMALPTQDTRATSSPKEDTTQNGLFLQKDTRISLQIQKHPQEFNQNEQLQNDVEFDSSNQQASTIPAFPTAVEFFARSTVSSTMSTSSKESNYMAALRNPEPRSQLAGGSFHASAELESLFASTEDLLKPHQALSYKPSSSSVTGTNFHKFSGASSENYVYFLDLTKKILKKSLTEVARSTDAHQLLINLINLRNSPILNSHQAEVIQDYIDNFNGLVAYYPSYEQQIDMGTSALVYSIEEKQRNIANLKAFYQRSKIMTKTLSDTKEALKKMLHETEVEEDRIKTSMEGVYIDLVAKKGELETDISVLSKAKSHQQEAAEKARKASDSWEKLRNLFT